MQTEDLASRTFLAVAPGSGGNIAQDKPTKVPRANRGSALKKRSKALGGTHGRPVKGHSASAHLRNQGIPAERHGRFLAKAWVDATRFPDALVQVAVFEVVASGFVRLVFRSFPVPIPCVGTKMPLVTRSPPGPKAPLQAQSLTSHVKDPWTNGKTKSARPRVFAASSFGDPTDFR
jgi:hypothetical protein